MRPSWSKSINSAVAFRFVVGESAMNNGGLGQFLLGMGQWACDSSPCAGWLFLASGQLSNDVAKMVATTPQGRKVEIPVRNAWFAAFAHRDPGEKGKSVRGTLVAYDASGKVLESDEYIAMPTSAR